MGVSRATRGDSMRGLDVLDDFPTLGSSFPAWKPLPKIHSYMVACTQIGQLEASIISTSFMGPVSLSGRQVSHDLC